MDFKKVSPAVFKMGGGDWEKRPDGLPRHEVSLTNGFEISALPVSFEDYARFLRETGRAEDIENDRSFAVGMSWHGAAAFCQWLGDCRLPTEAEWEYCARNARELGLDRMCDQYLREWCFDWYDHYTDLPETDPAGPDSGHFKVVRGGWLDSPLRYNEYPLDVWTRGSLPPSYTHFPGDPNPFGRHNTGFRVVRGKQPVTNGKKPVFAVSRMVSRQAPRTEARLLEKPYFRKRYLFPSPPDNSTNEEIRMVGLNPQLRCHNHSPGLAAAPNGDLIVSIYSTYHEYDAEAGLMAARLRYGCDRWEMPDMFLNPVGVNDHAPLLFTDGDGVIYHFWGWQQLDNSFPFQYCYSKDSGESWSEIIFPRFPEKAERVIRQPVNSAFRAADGYCYLACDATEGSASVLWRSRDMIHWENPKGRTAGRHSTAVERLDGSLLALGGKNSDIDGYMPQAVSYDKGGSWEVSKTPFPALTSGQRPCVIRLASGRLFFCADYQNKQGQRPYPEDDSRWGAYAAWSGDDGKTWSFRSLPGAQPRKKHPHLYMGGASTLGYSVCRQSADGLIHIICTNTHPCLHFALNEQWLLHGGEPEELMSDGISAVSEVTEYREHYEGGALKCVYSGGIGDNGRFVLHGAETWYYPSGRIMAKAEYDRGKRVGSYTLYRENGGKKWEWRYDPTGEKPDRYGTFYSGGERKSTAGYRGSFAEGKAQLFGRGGEVLAEAEFLAGGIVSRTDLELDIPAPMAEFLE